MLNRDKLIDGEQMTTSGEGGKGWTDLRGGRIEQKGKGLMSMDNSVLVAAGKRKYKGTKW